MFRKLYWVVEEAEPTGYRVTGVYTSIYDLVDTGIKAAAIRLTLTPLDRRDQPIGCWSSFDNIQTDLAPLLEKGELKLDDVQYLASTLK